MENEWNEMLKKLLYYQKEGTVVHVATKYKTFVNGKITEIRNEEDKDLTKVSFAVNDRKLGTFWLLITEVVKIDKFIEPYKSGESIKKWVDKNGS